MGKSVKGVKAKSLHFSWETHVPKPDKSAVLKSQHQQACVFASFDARSPSKGTVGKE